MKQFIVDRHTTPNTPTLEQVPTEKIPIYDDLDAAAADLANLAENQIIATHDTGSELSAPVDTVQSGNMHAVTSNAVFNACSPNYAQKQLIFDGLTHYQNTSYVVPDNGFIIASGWGTRQDNSYIICIINGIRIQTQGNADEVIGITVPVRKGDVIKLDIHLATQNYGMYFVPCN